MNNFDKYNESRRRDGGWFCPICNENFFTRALLRAHQRENNHFGEKGHGNRKVNWTCQFCGETRFSPLGSKTFHEKYCKCNPNHEIFIGHKVSEETKKKISKTGKERKSLGGYRHGSGRGKKGWYKGYYCDSSWELAYIVYNLEHNISFIRNEELFPYIFNGEKHNYKPDFIEGDTYVEVKGYITEQVIAKESFFNKPLKRLDKKGLKPYLDYVINKYGKNFWEVLYEK